jgi:hypothetical protein
MIKTIYSRYLHVGNRTRESAVPTHLNTSDEVKTQPTKSVSQVMKKVEEDTSTKIKKKTTGKRSDKKYIVFNP